MFNSNVQPKVKKKLVPKEPWYCHRCDSDNASYYSKCPKCGAHREH